MHHPGLTAADSTALPVTHQHHQNDDDDDDVTNGYW